MAVVIFYVLAEADVAASYQKAAELVDNHYQQGRRVYIHVENEATAFTMDDYLWTFRPASFIPHNLYGEGLTPPPPVQIGFQSDPTHHHDVLVNLSDKIPVFATRFASIIELLVNNEPSLALGRERYRHYRQTGHTVEYHDLRKAVTS